MSISATKLTFAFGFIILLLSGLWELAGIPTFITKISFFVILLFISGILFLSKKLRISMFETILFFTLVPYLIILYFIYPDLSTLISIFQVFSPIIILILILNISHELNNKSNFFKEYIKYFVILQIIAAFIKFFLIGQGEGQGIGTLSIQAGSLSTFIGFIICLFALVHKSKGNFMLYILFFLLALLFVIINEKRLGILIVAALAFYSSYYGEGSKKYLSNLFLKPALIISLSIIFIYLGITFVPTIIEGFTIANFDERVWTYLTATQSDGTAIGRLAGLIQTYELLTLNNQFYLGMGPETYLSSNISGVTDEFFNPIALTIVLGRFGFIGLFFWLLYFVYLYRISKADSLLRIFVLYLLFDFIIYSNSIFLSHSLVLIFAAFYNSKRFSDIKN
tara:strand:- start:497 stop:1681 length:1185 start_codon:yes stop_codon:yes gene_type:complete